MGDGDVFGVGWDGRYFREKTILTKKIHIYLHISFFFRTFAADFILRRYAHMRTGTYEHCVEARRNVVYRHV